MGCIKYKKDQWLSMERWRTEVETVNKTNVYLRASDGERKWFTIEPSRLGKQAGNGVYAARPFRKGETLTYYGGCCVRPICAAHTAES